MPITPRGAEPLLLKPIRKASPAWSRDFTFIRNLCMAMLRLCRRAFMSLMREERGKKITAEEAWKRLFDKHEPMPDSLVKLGSMLLRWHEHDYKRRSPQEAAQEEEDTALTENDYELMERALAERKKRP